MPLSPTFREGEDIEKFLAGRFRAQQGGRLLPTRRTRVSTGTITDKDGKKIRGFIRITDDVGPDGKRRETKTEFKPFNKQRGEDATEQTIPSDVAREFLRLNNPEQFGLTTFSKRYTDQEQKDVETTKKAAEIFGGQVPENAMNNGQGDAGHLSETPEITKDIRVNRTMPSEVDSEGGTAFSGYVIQAGVPKTPTGTPNLFVKVPADGSAPSYVSARVIGDPDAEYYEVAQTYGDIHLDRF